MRIEKNVPAPSGKTTRGRKSKYPFAHMEVGDSFTVTISEGAYVVGSAAGAYGRRHNKKFTTRVAGGLARVWRVS